MTSKHNVLIAGAALLGLALTSTALAQPGTLKNRRASALALPPHIAERFDSDGDGTLNRRERADAQAAAREFLAELKAEFDANGDGVLSETEREEAKEAVHERYVIPRFDEDGDGVLNDSEQAAADESAARWAERRQRNAEMRRRAKDQFDLNGDGQLDETEREAAREALRNRRAR